MNFFNKESKTYLKKKNFFLGGWGWGRGEARVNEFFFFFTKKPNLKKKFFFWVRGGGGRGETGEGGD